MKILVTGGAGYIGSITVQELVKAGHQVVIFDSLVHGHKQAVAGVPTVVGETQDKQLVSRVLTEEKIQAVIHFAAFIETGEAMREPHKYFENNVYGSLQLVKAMVETGVDTLVFSSTAGVYGNPVRLPITEDDPKDPSSPYGESKLMVERMLKWFDQIHNLRSITLRYFNAAGATLDGKLGEAHDPESHLVPNLLKAALTTKPVTINGDDYPTADGTCIRDYIHVLDLAQAHILALEALKKGHKTDTYNVGTGKGYSNKEVLKMVEQVSGKELAVRYGPRRPGDAAELVADSSKLQKEFGWKPHCSDLKTIVETAYKWHRQNRW
jgi:UDP-glucose-4-epimerase GalE